MVEISKAHSDAIKRVEEDIKRRQSIAAARLAAEQQKEIDRRNHAEALLGRAIDDVTYFRLRDVTKYEIFVEIARETPLVFDVWEQSTMDCLRFLCRPSTGQDNFNRRFREIRDWRPEV